MTLTYPVFSLTWVKCPIHSIQVGLFPKLPGSSKLRTRYFVPFCNALQKELSFKNTFELPQVPEIDVSSEVTTPNPSHKYS